MRTLIDQAITSTDPLTVEHTPPPQAAATTWQLAATTAALTCSFQAYNGPTIGWVEFLSQAVAAGDCVFVVVDHPKLSVRLVATPSTGSGHIFIGVGDANARGP